MTASAISQRHPREGKGMRVQDVELHHELHGSISKIVELLRG